MPQDAAQAKPVTTNKNVVFSKVYFAVDGDELNGLSEYLSLYFIYCLCH